MALVPWSGVALRCSYREHMPRQARRQAGKTSAWLGQQKAKYSRVDQLFHCRVDCRAVVPLQGHVYDSWVVQVARYPLQALCHVYGSQWHVQGDSGKWVRQAGRRERAGQGRTSTWHGGTWRVWRTALRNARNAQLFKPNTVRHTGMCVLVPL